jgi:hypothetical protein
VRKIILSLTGLLLFSVAYSQKINYQKTFEEGLAKAKSQKKLLVVSVIPPKPDIAAHPELVNAFVSAIDNPEVVNLFNKNFINYTVPISDTVAVTLRNKYPTTVYPAYFFLDGRGNLVYKDGGNSRTNDKYFNMSKQALTAAVSGKTLSDYEDKYNKGDINAAFLKEYITMRQDLGIIDNAKLIEMYVDHIDPQSFQNYSEVLFVLKAGPYAYGKAYSLCYANRKLVDSIYKKEPVAVRSGINLAIINNTMKESVNKKDANLAQQAANYLAGTWLRTNQRQGMISSQGKMIYYYHAVKDTASYYRQAMFYYDNYYMNISADSAKKIDNTVFDSRNKAILAKNKPDTIKTYVKGPDSVKRLVTKITSVRTTTTASDISAIASTLNNAAWEFYTAGTHNQTYLLKALAWSKRSIELNAVYSNYDTLAHLLYQLGFFEEAASAQSKAVSLAETRKSDSKEIEHLKSELDKIKTHKI